MAGDGGNNTPTGAAAAAASKNNQKQSSPHTSRTATPLPSKAQQAPPALNMYQKIAIVRNPQDSLTFEDPEGHTKSISVEELGDALTATAVRMECVDIVCGIVVHVERIY